MQEVLEKIIETFKKMDSITFSSFSKPLISIEDAIGIVETEAKKYNGGWILCSERLPEKGGTYFVTAAENELYHTTFVKWQKRHKKWDLTGSRAYWRVIAWKPLPEPYSPERKSGNEK